jgi:uncharacterized protein
VYGDSQDKIPPNDYLRKLQQDSQAHREAVLATYAFEQPNYPKQDWTAGYKTTLALMQEGASAIYHGVILVPLTEKITCVSVPDLLIREPGRSQWGDWHYVPLDIRLGKRPKQEYQLVVTFHAWAISIAQGIFPQVAWLHLRDRKRYSIQVATWLPRLQTTLNAYVQILQQTQPPEVFIARNKCNLCHWYQHCYTLAQSQRHLSLLPGVTLNRYRDLQALQVTTLEALAQSSVKQLAPAPSLQSVAPQLIRQAQANWSQQPLLHNQNPIPLPDAAIELYFDIEAEPDLGVAYLHGLLVVDVHAQTEVFYPALAENPCHEQQAWHEFLKMVAAYPHAPIYHFCPYEVQTVQRLAHLYQTPKLEIDSLLHRFWDLHHWIVTHLTLPVESYALKTIARWLDFEWRDADASGAQSIYWYGQWLETGDRAYLNAILRYNEDDCRATHHIRSWLRQQFMQQSLAP